VAAEYSNNNELIEIAKNISSKVEFFEGFIKIAKEF